MRTYEKHNPWIYAAYKGEKYLCDGTREEICRKLGIKRATFAFYRTNYYRKNRYHKGRIYKKNDNLGIVIVRIDGKDKIWNEKE